jgi:hypothetical protein
MKEFSLEGEHDEFNDSHLKERLLASVRWVNLILLKNVEVDYFINELTHKSNTLKFWIKILCPTYL